MQTTSSGSSVRCAFFFICNDCLHHIRDLTVCKEGDGQYKGGRTVYKGEWTINKDSVKGRTDSIKGGTDSI